MPDVLELARAQVLAFRAERHGLTKRAPKSDLVDAAAPAGIRRTRLTALSFAARVKGAVADDVAGAHAHMELVAVFGPRGTVTIVRPDDVSLFTTGLAPADEESLRAVMKAFFRFGGGEGYTAVDAVRITADAILDALAGGAVAKHELTSAVTAAIPKVLAPPCRGRCPDPHVEDILFRMACAPAGVCFEGDGESLVLARQWLGKAPPKATRHDLVRRYLSVYGPSTPTALAEWAGTSPTDARRSLAELATETIDCTIDGRKAGVLLATDAPAITMAKFPRGIRFLPPYDPYLMDRDRDTLVPDRAPQKTVWRATSNPGLLLVDGDPAGTWRTATTKSGIEVKVQPITSALPPPKDLEPEAQLVAKSSGKDLPVSVTIS